eukprot:CAMPEP_0203739548 /NCGR_PEP_ID=MMETSP0092-20131115/46494_1 /ASSEMBLY_ACC=CAM_ASM_001090 /TAXON_ID=426623 /ORGANISM="Chaetoceros affinis, Strain CCMP159" /LENGTH=142 /DNA_ID=CAMNT_0050625673 /DNA_START=18 /DNA_END=443 /DNA_ORIENTATION=-
MSTSEETATPYGKYAWPENLYEELYDTGILSFFVYVFGYIVHAARKHPDEFDGISVDSESHQVYKSQIPDEDNVLKRSFTPAEMKSIVQANISILSKEFSDFRGDNLTEIYKWLDYLTTQSEESKLERPFTIEEYDDKFQSE